MKKLGAQLRTARSKGSALDVKMVHGCARRGPTLAHGYNHVSAPYLAFLSLGRLCQWSPRQSLFHYSVSGPHRGGQPPSPLARCVHPILAVGEPSPTAMIGPQDVHLRGHFPNGDT